uniref:Uncharacterized protein n=1 Tax=Fagus sylvatica TaxID=28930 RepID=A0A2N9FIR8_FAGSY
MTGLIEDDGGSSEDEVEKLESDVKQMAQKLLEYRTTLPDQLRSILTSVLTAQRPVFPDPSEPPNPGWPIHGSKEARELEMITKWKFDVGCSQVSQAWVESQSVTRLEHVGMQEDRLKIVRGDYVQKRIKRLLKNYDYLEDKISSNVSAMPIVLKRMKECISRIDKLDSNNGIIHPAFKRKKTS